MLNESTDTSTDAQKTEALIDAHLCFHAAHHREEGGVGAARDEPEQLLRDASPEHPLEHR